MIAGLVVSSVLATGVASKFLPKLYEAKTTLLPARDELTGSGIGVGGAEKNGRSGGSIQSALRNSSEATQADILTTLFGSRTLVEEVVRQLDLVRYYGAKSLRDAMSALRTEITIQQTPNKAFEVVVLSKDPKVAADIANSCASGIDRLYREFNMSSSKRVRTFIEARLAEKAKKLTEAEIALAKFENENRVRHRTEGTGGAGDLVIAAEVHGTIMELEVQLAGLREYALPSHPMSNRLQAQIHELRAQLDRLEQERVRGVGTNKGPRVPLSKKLYPSFEETTSVDFDLVRLNRRVKIEESVYGMLVGMLESAKIAEAKDLPTLLVIDSALPPKFPTKPMPLRYMSVAAALSLVLGVLFALFLNYLERLRAQEAVSVQRVDGDGQIAAVDSSDNDNKKKAKKKAYPASPKEIERLHS